MRFKVVRLFFVFAALAIIARLGFWQIISFDELTARAEDQRVDSKQIKSERGSIFFADGSMFASSQPSFLIFAQPKVLKDPRYTARVISEILWEDYYVGNEDIKKITDEEKKAKLQGIEDGFYKQMTKNLFWVSLGKRVGIDTKEKIEKRDLEGVGFEPSTTRFYPEASAAAHLLGFVGSNDYGRDTGYFGLEGYYNGELKGEMGVLTQEKDAMGLPILIGKFFNKEAKAGKTITLNIDRTIQFIVEEKLRKGIEKYGAKEASAVVLDPKTGNVLAMASFPSYDPENASNFPSEYFKNPLIADGYEPGSTFKVLVMAAGVNEGVVKSDTKCDICGAPLSVGGFLIRTWNNKYQENITMKDTIVHSDNTGMVFVARKLGFEKLYEYIKKFGFGSLTGVDLQDEHTPFLREKAGWREIDLATASFGQGISVTGMQLVRAVAMIANGGRLMEPHIAKIIDDGEKKVEIGPREIARPISEEAAREITEMMVAAVEEGEAKYLKPKGYKVAGKTGTAQIPIAGHYDPNKTIASFIGFAPANDPKFIMLVRYREPTSSIYGAETAAPTFFEIAKELFMYYGIAPSE